MPDNGYSQDILREIRALKDLNVFLVRDVYDRITKVDAKVRNYILSMHESGMTVQSKKFISDRYEKVDQENFKRIYHDIAEEHLPAIKRYVDALLRQFDAATGMTMNDIRLETPGSLDSNDASADFIKRTQSVQDYLVQVNALCDYMDFLVKQCDELKDVVLQYKKYCTDYLIESGVPNEVVKDYYYKYAVYLVPDIEQYIIKGFHDDYIYLKLVYLEVVNSLTDLGITHIRTPRSLSDANVDGVDTITLKPTGK